jgi:hypothetical protein
MTPTPRTCTLGDAADFSAKLPSLVDVARLASTAPWGLGSSGARSIAAAAPAPAPERRVESGLDVQCHGGRHAPDGHHVGGPHRGGFSAAADDDRAGSVCYGFCRTARQFARAGVGRPSAHAGATLVGIGAACPFRMTLPSRRTLLAV